MFRFAQCLSVYVAIAALSGCQGVVLAPHPRKPVVVHKAGPPAHAPAHGHKRKHDHGHKRKHQSGPELLFDAGLGVYVVAGHADIYFHDGWFIRVHNGSWQVSATLDGSWQAKSAAWVPSSLRFKHHGKKQKARGRGVAKPAW